MRGWERTLLFCGYLFLLSTYGYAAKPTAKVQESFAAYWTAEPGWETELKLRSNLVVGELTVVPYLRLASGREIMLDPVTIPPRDTVSVEVAGALAKHASEISTNLEHSAQ